MVFWVLKEKVKCSTSNSMVLLVLVNAPNLCISVDTGVYEENKTQTFCFSSLKTAIKKEINLSGMQIGS